MVTIDDLICLFKKSGSVGWESLEYAFRPDVLSRQFIALEAKGACFIRLFHFDIFEAQQEVLGVKPSLFNNQFLL
jgi:hypothetical protein